MTPSPTAAAADAPPVTLFYSYAHEDEPLRDELQGHLKILERRGWIAPWHDRRIVAGEDWAAAIDRHLDRAELVLLLVSMDFINSDYIFGRELRSALDRHADGRCVVVPVFVRAVDLQPEDAEDIPFLKLQGLPTDLRPVTSWPNRDEAWTCVAKGLRATVKAIREGRVATPGTDAGRAATRGAAAPATPAAAPLPSAAQASPVVRAASPASDPLLWDVMRGVVAQVEAGHRARGSVLDREGEQALMAGSAS